MKGKLNLICSVFQLVFGILAIIAFVILKLYGENMSKWMLTLIIAIVFVIIGTRGIINYKKKIDKGAE